MPWKLARIASPIFDELIIFVALRMMKNDMAEAIGFQLRQACQVFGRFHRVAVDGALLMPGAEQGIGANVIEGALGRAADGAFRMSITAKRLIKIVYLRVQPSHRQVDQANFFSLVFRRQPIEKGELRFGEKTSRESACSIQRRQGRPAAG